MRTSTGHARTPRRRISATAASIVAIVLSGCFEMADPMTTIWMINESSEPHWLVLETTYPSEIGYPPSEPSFLYWACPARTYSTANASPAIDEITYTGRLAVLDRDCREVASFPYDWPSPESGVQSAGIRIADGEPPRFQRGPIDFAGLNPNWGSGTPEEGCQMPAAPTRSAGSTPPPR